MSQLQHNMVTALGSSQQISVFITGELWMSSRVGYYQTFCIGIQRTISQYTVVVLVKIQDGLTCCVVLYFDMPDRYLS